MAGSCLRTSPESPPNEVLGPHLLRDGIPSSGTQEAAEDSPGLFVFFVIGEAPHTAAEAAQLRAVLR